MRPINFLVIFFSLVFCLLQISPTYAQEGESTTPEVESSGDAATDEITLTDEELTALLERVDRFYIDQEIASLTVDIDIYRDPSHRLNDVNIRTGNPSGIAGLS